MDKIEAHQKALLHRAFSVFIFNGKNEMLLQQRAEAKYHSGGLWSNACCSHPLPGEDNLQAAQRRLKEELGFQASLHEAFSFTYKTAFENGLTEFEYDHVFIGQFDGTPDPDPEEVMGTKYLALESIRAELNTHPHHYSSWFRIAFPLLAEYLLKNGLNGIPATK